MTKEERYYALETAGVDKFYFAKRSDLDTKLNNIPYIMSIAKSDGRVYVDYDQSIEVCKDKQTAAKFILEYFARK